MLQRERLSQKLDAMVLCEIRSLFGMGIKGQRVKREQAISEYLASIGRKGGQSRSEEKIKAGRENIKKARAVKLRRPRDGDA
jgi:hypothetical protein